jgi:hypothetical protein
LSFADGNVSCCCGSRVNFAVFPRF